MKSNCWLWFILDSGLTGGREVLGGSLTMNKCQVRQDKSFFAHHQALAMTCLTQKQTSVFHKFFPWSTKSLWNNTIKLCSTWFKSSFSGLLEPPGGRSLWPKVTMNTCAARGMPGLTVPWQHWRLSGMGHCDHQLWERCFEVLKLSWQWWSLSPALGPLGGPWSACLWSVGLNTNISVFVRKRG